MACGAISSGQGFLSSTLAHIDCQGSSIGAYGYGALADPNSTVALALTGVLTIFVALFGVRLLLGHNIDSRGVVGDTVRVGLVLAIATSWPAWRVMGYNLVLDGPAEVARMIGGASGLPGSNETLNQQLQIADNAIVSMTQYGTGRLTGGISPAIDTGETFSGIALADQFALGMGRAIFLSSAIGSQAIVRLTAGILLALAPLLAGLLLFAGTRSIFIGWVRGLVFCALGSLALLLIQGAQLAVMFPWQSEVLARRVENIYAPSAPTELLVLSLAFAITMAGALFVIGRIVFWPVLEAAAINLRDDARRAGSISTPAVIGGGGLSSEPEDRAHAISRHVADSIRREQITSTGSRVPVSMAASSTTSDVVVASGPGTSAAGGSALGESYRRNRRRATGSALKRDRN